MNALGMCPHNNIAGYCPACSHHKKEIAMSGLGSCPEGYYRLKVFGVDTGQCLPNLSTAAEGAQTGVMSSVGTGVASSPATAQAAQNVAANALGTNIITFYKTKPVVAWGLTAVGVLFFVYGGMSFFRGK
ncbi:MAG: hypothetical protein HC883_00240 [Bdellovibrionaceae bacterium]|nr:hypothetical protein [Pseudobdellovibrionaceae bacterium]